VKGLRRVLKLPEVRRNRREDDGAIDAMAEALLISRADALMRLVIGTSGFSTFAYLANALRVQNEWVSDARDLERWTPMPNYLVTESCGADRCFAAPSEVRMASVAWHGKEYTRRSCGDVIERLHPGGKEDPGCAALKPATLKRKGVKNVEEDAPIPGAEINESDAGKLRDAEPTGDAGSRLLTFHALFRSLWNSVFGKDEL